MYKIILFFLLFIPGIANSQNSIDKTKAAKLLEEIKPLYESYFSLQIRNHDSAKIVCNILIEKFKEIYYVDTTDKKIGDYLVECYFYNKDYVKAINWCNHQILYHSNNVDNIYYFQTLAIAYLNLGELNLGKKYIAKAITINETNPDWNDLSPVFLLNLKSFIDDIIKGNDSVEVSFLKSKNISVDQYANQIFNFLMPYAEKSTQDVQMQYRNEINIFK